MAEHEGCKPPSFAGIVDGQSVDHGVGLMAFPGPPEGFVTCFTIKGNAGIRNDTVPVCHHISVVVPDIICHGIPVGIFLLPLVHPLVPEELPRLFYDFPATVNFLIRGASECGTCS